MPAWRPGSPVGASTSAATLRVPRSPDPPPTPPVPQRGTGSATPVRSAAPVTVDSPVFQRETSASAHGSTADPRVGPVRTCVGCRTRALADELLRVVAGVGGNGECAVTVDPAGILPGRGAWLHPDEQCLHAAIRRRAFTRALRITGSPELSGVIEYVENLSAGPLAQQENR
ncbi:YlxR family protein [Mycobacterium sp. WMMD1722]|uniref:YlxR family protein n=1 Tax=Mycobacterium sp. WMMD1722 TaxID=3404117 RepID=UPI003BF5753B